MDLAVERRVDYDGSAVLNYTFGNRCEKKIEIDLAYTKVIGRDEEGNEVALRPFDPGLQIQPLPLDAGMVGHEAIAYPAATKLVQVCVDTASIVHRSDARWLCFARRPDPAPPVLVEDTRTPGERLELENSERDRADQQGEEPNRTKIEDDTRPEVP